MRYPGRCAVIVAVLGLQLWAIVPFADQRKERAWPFVPYPMYSAPHAYGDYTVVQSLVGTRCRGGPPVVLGPADVGASTGKHFQFLLGAAAMPRGAQARARIAAEADRVAPGRWCGLEIQQESVAVAKRGPVWLTPAPVVEARWRRE
ncbi:MAG TPA: hypothetical protein VGD56_16915 [Gemmatirosa sp.]